MPSLLTTFRYGIITATCLLVIVTALEYLHRKNLLDTIWNIFMAFLLVWFLGFLTWMGLEAYELATAEPKTENAADRGC